MRPAPVLLLMMALSASCKGPPPAPPPPPRPAPPVEAEADAGQAPDGEDPKAWVSYGPDGKTALRQKSVGGVCFAECRLGDASLVWEGVAPCFAEKYERHFVSNDCERVVILIPAPDRGKAWSATEVLRVYARNQLEYAVAGSTVVSEKRMRTSTSWLKGCYGVPGVEPGYAPDGASIVYETIEGKAGSIPLVVSSKRAKPLK